MQILVTGGAGFIGSALCRLLIARTDVSVVNLDKLTYAATLTSLSEIETSDRYTLVEGDIGDVRLVEALFEAYRFDAVIHLAAETHVDRSISGASPFVQTNILGTFVLLQAALRHWEGQKGEARDRFRFLHVSTDEVFGSLPSTGRFTEDSRYDPRSPYAATKASADHLVRAWGSTYGLPVMISNCSNNYGPYQFPEKLIPLTILNALAGRPIGVYGDGGQVRDWLYVEDHARALRLILEQGVSHQTYAIGGDAERTNLQVVNAVCDLVGDGLAASLVRFVEDRPGHDRRYAVDSSKLRRLLGWRPQVTFEEGLARTVDWYRRRDAWWGPLRQRYEGARLGLIRPDDEPNAL